jgi:hypothetical protein
MFPSYLEFRTMEKIHKPSNSEHYIQRQKPLECTFYLDQLHLAMDGYIRFGSLHDMKAKFGGNAFAFLYRFYLY